MEKKSLQRRQKNCTKGSLRAQPRTANQTLLIPLILLNLILLWNPAPLHAQGPLVNGGNHSGAIAGAGGADRWTFNAQARDHVYVRVSKTSGAAAPAFGIIDASNNLVGISSVESSASDNSARLDYIAAASGAFTLVVGPGLAGGGGNYRVDFLRMPDTVATPSGETGGPLVNEGRHEGAIAIGDLDTWTFSAGPGDLIELRMAQLSGGEGFVPRLRIFDSTGSKLAEASGGADSSTSEARLSFHPASTNSFTVVVDSHTPDGAGNYRLHMVKLPAPVATPTSDTGGPLTSGGRHDGAISVGDLDAWTFTAGAGEKIFLRAAQTSGETDFAPRIRVYNEAGQLVAINGAESEARLEYTSPQTGTFTVLMGSSSAEGTGNYRLFYLKLPGAFITPSGDDGAPLVSGTTQNGSTTVGDLDVWSFDATAGDRITLRLSQLSGEEAYSPRMRVFDPAGGLIAYGHDPISSDTSSNSVTLIIPSTGTFNVMIDSSLVGGAGTYRLNSVLENGPFTPPAATGTALAIGSNNEGELGLAEEDRWTFEASAGEQIFLRAGVLTSSHDFNADLRVRVYDSHGALLGDFSHSSDPSVTLTSMIGGKHTVVLSFNTGHTGTYRLHYLKVPGTFLIPGGDDGGVLTNGGNHEGDVALGDVDPWTFEASAGEQIFLRAGVLTSSHDFNADLRMRVYDPHGALLGDFSHSSDPSVTLTSMIGGKHTVVLSFNTGHTGTYRLHYLKVPGTFLIPGGDDGEVLSSGGNHEGAVTLGDMDPWTFEVSAGEQILLRAGVLTSSHDFNAELRMRVYDPQGALIGNFSDSSDPSVTLTSMIGGKHTVVLSFNTGHTGTYRLHYLKVPGTFIIPGGDDGGALVNGGNHEGAITLGDLDPWTYEAVAGEQILLRAGVLTSSHDFNAQLRVRVYDPHGALIGDFSDNSDPSVTLTAMIGGKHTVVLSFNTGHVGTYRLHYLKVPGTFITPGGDDGGALRSGGNHEGAVTLGDLDPWTFEASEGEQILLRAGVLTSSHDFNAQLRVQVYDPHGALIGNFSDNSDPSVTLTAMIGGKHTVVLSFNTGHVGTYRLHFIHSPQSFTIPGGDEGGALAKDLAEEGVITIGDLDAWSFEADGRNPITLRMQELTGGNGFSPSLRLYGPTGQLVASHSHATLAQISIGAPDGGIYVVVASAGGAGGTGTYELSTVGLREQGKQLRYAQTGTNSFTVNWPAALAGAVLQQNSILATNGWKDIGIITTNGLNARFTVPVETEGKRFFRLKP